MVRFLVICPLLVCVVPCVADGTSSEEFRRIEALIHSPSRPTIDNFASLEWVIDSSDQVLTATLVEEDGARRFELNDVLKPSGKEKVKWPAGEEARLSAIADLYQPGDQVLFCLWADGKDQAVRLYDYFALIPVDDPRRKDALGFYKNLPEKPDGTTKMYLTRKNNTAGFSWLAIDKKGQWIRSHDDLLKRVKSRLTNGSRVPPDCDREAVVEGKSVYGGWYQYQPQEPERSGAEFPHLLVPPESEYREGYIWDPGPKERRSHQGALPAIARMANYRDDRMIAQLKELLEDKLVQEQQRRLPDRAIVTSVFYVWGEDEPPGKGAPQVEIRRTFVLRKAAYESLKKMKVEVEQPKLSPD